MKRHFLSIMAGVIFFLLTSLHAKAYVIYDWVTEGVKTGYESGCGYTVSAQINISEKGYLDKFFVLADRNSFMWNISTLLNNGSVWNFTYPPYAFTYYVTLSGDRTRINGFGATVEEYGTTYYWKDQLMTHDDNEASGLFDVTSIWGDLGTIPYYSFTDEKHPAIGEWLFDTRFGFDGEWRLRPQTAPVPEPGTLVLWGFSFIALAMWRKRTELVNRLSKPGGQKPGGAGLVS